MVGQILRYMGWVKEHLAANDYDQYNVRGIIISKEKDDRLEYALKMLQKVNVFLYSVSFELRKVI